MNLVAHVPQLINGHKTLLSHTKIKPIGILNFIFAKCVHFRKGLDRYLQSKINKYMYLEAPTVIIMTGSIYIILYIKICLHMRSVYCDCFRGFPVHEGKTFLIPLSIKIPYVVKIHFN